MSQNPETNPFDDDLRSKFEDASFEPPKGLWENIEKELPERLPFYYRFKYPIAAAVLAFAFISTLIIYNRYDTSIPNKQEFIAKNIKKRSKHSTLNASSQINLALLDEFKSSSDDEVAELSNVSLQNQTTKASSQSSSVATSTQGFDGGSYSVNSPTDNISSETSAQKNSENSNRKSKSGKRKKYISKDVLNGSTEDIQVESAVSSIHSAENVVEVVEENTLLNKESESVEKLDLLASDLFHNDEEPKLKNKSSKSKKNKFVNKGLVVGPVLGSHFTAMTKRSKEGVNTSNMEQTATFGNSYGLNVGYVINSHWTVGAEWIYNSAEGQNFKDVINGQDVDKFIALDYMKIPVYVKYAHKFITRYDKSPITLNFIGGVHYSRLKSVNTFVDNQIAPVPVNYNEHEWGMLGGVEFDIFPTNRLYFTFGSRFTFNADLKQFPRIRGRNGSDPFSVQAGVYAKINYVFSFKKSESTSLKNL